MLPSVQYFVLCVFLSGMLWLATNQVWQERPDGFPANWSLPLPLSQPPAMSPLRGALYTHLYPLCVVVHVRRTPSVVSVTLLLKCHSTDSVCFTAWFQCPSVSYPHTPSCCVVNLPSVEHQQLAQRGA